MIFKKDIVFVTEHGRGIPPMIVIGGSYKDLLYSVRYEKKTFKYKAKKIILDKFRSIDA